MAEIFELNGTDHVRSAFPDFYEELKKDGFIQNYHQLFTYAFLIGLLDGNKSTTPKTKDIFQVANINSDNLKVIKGIALMKLDVNNGDELLKEMMDYADWGVHLIRKEYENDKTIRLDKYID